MIKYIPKSNLLFFIHVASYCQHLLNHLTSIYGIKKFVFTLMSKRSFEKSKLTPCQECLTERKNEHVFLFVTTLNTKQQR